MFGQKLCQVLSEVRGGGASRGWGRPISHHGTFHLYVDCRNINWFAGDIAIAIIHTMYLPEIKQNGNYHPLEKRAENIKVE